MSKVKVGDIVIEEGKISIGGHVVVQGETPPSSPEASRPVRQKAPGVSPWEPEENSTLAFIRDLPIGGIPLVLIGVALALLGLFGTFLPSDPFIPVIGRIPLFIAGLGTVAVGTMKRRLAQGEGERDSSVEKLLEARISRLKPLLAEKSQENTIERLIARSRMTEEAVVEALLAMKQRGMIEEELNLDNGEWYYILSDAWDEARIERRKRAMSLEERHQALIERGNHEE